MKNLFRIFSVIIFALAICFPQMLKAINPLYQLEARNFTIVSGGTDGGSENGLTFDITIQHTNFAQSGPFIFASGAYYFNFNPAIANGGILTFSIIPNSSEFLDSNAIPMNPTIVGNQLRLQKNDTLPANPPIISTVYPGTRVIRVLITTSASSFAGVPLNLIWRDSTFGPPFTQVSAFIGANDSDITTNGTLIVNSFDPPLPVELTSFTSSVNKNQITLNWSTASEHNNLGFDIERLNVSNPVSSDWIKTGSVNGNGTTDQAKNYIFTEAAATGKYKYRLKQIDFNGNYEYHELRNEVNVGAPAKFYISQNYPNPFNPETRIDYDLAFDAEVSIIIYDITGREILKAVNEVQKAGYYNFRFNAGNQNSGIYFYSITAKNGDSYFSSTKKMILLK